MWRIARQIAVFATVLAQGSLCVWVLAQDVPPVGTLTVRVQGLNPIEGNLRLALFDSEQNFFKRSVRSEVFPVTAQRRTWIVENLPYGVYAVLAHHDVDASGKIERRWYGKPREPTGASNNAPARFGPPTFDDARFRLDSPTRSLTITLE